MRIALVVVLLVVLLLVVGWSGVELGLWLDHRFRATRFVSANPTATCPLVLYGNEATPMCRAPGPGW